MKRRMTLESAEQEEEAIRLGFSGKSADSECSQDRGSAQRGAIRINNMYILVR